MGIVGKRVWWPGMVPKRLVNLFAFFVAWTHTFFLACTLCSESLSISPKQKSWLFIFTTWKNFFLSFSSVFYAYQITLVKKQAKSPRPREERKDTKKVKKEPRIKKTAMIHKHETSKKPEWREGTITRSEEGQKSEAKLWQFQFFYPLSLVSCVSLPCSSENMAKVF